MASVRMKKLNETRLVFAFNTAREDYAKVRIKISLRLIFKYTALR
jgi:hypothetical protein